MRLLTTQIKKLIKNKIIDWVGHCNFGINHVNIQGGFRELKYLNIKSEDLKHIFGTLNNFKVKALQLQSFKLYLQLQTLVYTMATSEVVSKF